MIAGRPAVGLPQGAKGGVVLAPVFCWRARTALSAVAVTMGVFLGINSYSAEAKSGCRDVDRKFAAEPITGVNARKVELFANPETGGSLGERGATQIKAAAVLCEAPNLMLYVKIPDDIEGWVFGDDVEINRNYNLSSGCSKSEETRVGATRGSGDCGG